MRASSYLKSLYNFYNYKYFHNELPQETTLFFATRIGKSKSPEKSSCAVTYMYEDEPPIIVIQRTKVKSMRYIANDLLHEMVHLAKPRAWHGKVFQDEMKRLANRGVFEDIW